MASSVINNGEASLTQGRENGHVLAELQDLSWCDLLNYPLDTRTAQGAPPPFSMDGGFGGHDPSGYQSGVIDGSLGNADFDGNWNLMGSGPGFALATFNNSQTTQDFEVTPNNDIFSNSTGVVNFGVPDVNSTISELDHRIGGSNIGGSLGLENFSNVLDNMISHQSTSLDNLDPGFNMAIFDLDFLQGLNDSLPVEMFDEIHRSLNRDDVADHSMIVPNSSGVGTSLYPRGLGFGEALTREPLHLLEEHRPPETHYATEPGLFVPNMGAEVGAAQFNMPPGPYCTPQDSAVGLVSNRHSGSSVERHDESTACPNIILTTDTNLSSYEVDVKKADTKPTPQVTRKRNRYSNGEWEEADTHISRLYLDKGHTAEEVEFEMSVIHGFEASLSTIKKRVAGWGKGKRSRTAKALPAISAEGKIFEIISEQVRNFKSEEWKRQREANAKENENRRKLQIERGNKRGAKKRSSEELFHAIDSLFKGLFATGPKSWSADTRRFKSPSNTVNSAGAWQLLADQIASVHMLVEGQLYHHASFMLGQVLVGLRDAARICDPNFMVHFWTICHVLANIPVRSRKAFQGSPWLGWFLRHLQQILISTFGKHPLVVIVDSLFQVWKLSPRDLKPTLGLGHWKAIYTLGGLIGKDHNIVLNMGAHCTKSWKSKFSASSAMVELLRKPLITNARELEAEEVAEMKLDYLFAATKEKYNEADIMHEVSQTLSWAGQICRERANQHRLQYDSVTRVFFFASELVATYHLEVWKQPEQKQAKPQNLELGCKVIDEAIEILRHGDQQCRIRAASFSKRLSTWIKGHRRKAGARPKMAAVEEQKKKVLDERARTREIVREITKERIKGSRRRKWTPRKERVVEKDLLLGSLSA
ncbi:hypothetical protein NUW58_g6430 [Xylaria curta]|uniref:Uncharacterized protein n=1 Tax=Xylaria curta TaxID=42375 RepID=A0ACC1NVN0_9PEZI|nr:hypothetical protein NUW58_g6430 [Xylaria curta]